ncbi:MAG: glycoside hydrolase [Candidatus Hydrogenedentes bacterium]|nr:glycoside hydrolase [Candidatus Hydrogenedentota bacterium]
MKTFFIVVLSLLGVCSASWAGSAGAPLKVLRYGPVNDQIVDALSPGGLVQCNAGDLITTFGDKGDSAAGSKCYFVRSKDQGKTWAPPYMVIAPQNPKEGIAAGLVSLPNGELLMLLLRIAHSNSSRESVFGYRETTIELKVSQDNGASFASVGFLDTAPESLTSVSGAIYSLKNGDLIIPAYCYTSRPREHPGYQYGAGFFRSLDGGANWGPLEVVFDDPPSTEEVRQGFNEEAFAVREDGVIIAYARVDVHTGADYKQNNMWMCQSEDQGVTWTKPVETSIAGIYPVINMLPSGQFVMACGLRDSNVMRRTTSLFTSSDGINWTYRGHPYYSRTKGMPANSATGGSQAMLPMGENSLYIVFYAHDPALPGYHKTYVDGGLLEVLPAP